MKLIEPAAAERRRSQRIPLAVPLFARSLDPLATFYGRVHTLQVSSHGCVLHAPRPLKRGTELRLDVLSSNRTTTARVIHSDPTGTHLKTWTVALELDKPANFWGVQSPPSNWLEILDQSWSRESPSSGSVRGTDRENQQ